MKSFALLLFSPIWVSVCFALVILLVFEQYEAHPLTLPIFQIAFLWDVMYASATQMESQCLSSKITKHSSISKFLKHAEFLLFSFLRRYTKLFLINLLYTQSLIAHWDSFVFVMQLFLPVALVFHLVGLTTWKILMNTIVPFRLAVELPNYLFTLYDTAYLFSLTVESPNRCILFQSNPEIEFVLLSLIMGAFGPAYSWLISGMKKNDIPQMKFASIKVAIVWTTASLIVIAVSFAQNTQGELSLMSRKALFLYYCLLGGNAAQLQIIPKGIKPTNNKKLN